MDHHFHSCETCKYVRNQPDVFNTYSLICCKNTPQADVHGKANFPIVQEYNWCSKYKENASAS